MIIGSYPCCNETLVLEYEGPGFCKEECPHCNTTVWHKMSNLDPCSYTEEQFLTLFEIDETTRTIKEKSKS